MADPAGNGVGILTKLTGRQGFRHLAADRAILNPRLNLGRQGCFTGRIQEHERGQGTRHDQPGQNRGAVHRGNRSACPLSPWAGR